MVQFYYGFIKPSDKSKEVFLHISALEQAGIKDIDLGSIQELLWIRLR